MNAQEGDILSRKYPLGELLVEGKTKWIYEVKGDGTLVIAMSKDDITAGDGAKHDIIPDKGQLANKTTCNVFRLLTTCGVPLAFVVQDSATSFVAQNCSMLPFEVVVRREAHGSYLKRAPHLLKGHLFPRLVVEFYLKTAGKSWKEYDLICDDPFMIRDSEAGEIQLFDPTKPIRAQEPFLILRDDEVFAEEGEWKHFPEMEDIARKTFLILEKAWQIESGTLFDFKVEFGLDHKSNLLLADVVDNDSWRVSLEGSDVSKQSYRDGEGLDVVAEKFTQVAEITSRFRLPRQQIILWRGSDKDDLGAFSEAFRSLKDDIVEYVTCSMHKEPVWGIQTLHRLVQDVPDSVVIVFVGRSNGAGPTLSAATNVPVITVPASVKGFPDDVWSSLRTPSKVPVMTVLEPANAALAALNILSARNPYLYSVVRQQMEGRMANVVTI